MWTALDDAQTVCCVDSFSSCAFQCQTDFGMPEPASVVQRRCFASFQNSLRYTSGLCLLLWNNVNSPTQVLHFFSERALDQNLPSFQIIFVIKAKRLAYLTYPNKKSRSHLPSHLRYPYNVPVLEHELVAKMIYLPISCSYKEIDTNRSFVASKVFLYQDQENFRSILVPRTTLQNSSSREKPCPKTEKKNRKRQENLPTRMESFTTEIDKDKTLRNPQNLRLKQ